MPPDPPDCTLPPGPDPGGAALGPPAPRLPADQRNHWLLADDPTLLAACRRTTHRVRGPGGQHRNKTESGVALVHGPTGVEGWAGERRSQHENQAVAVGRLRAALAAEVRAPFVAGDLPPAWTRVITPGRPLKLPRRDPARWVVLATALDAFAAAQGQLRTAAESLGLSTGQLVKLLAEERCIWQAAQQERSRHGLGALQA